MSSSPQERPHQAMVSLVVLLVLAVLVLIALMRLVTPTDDRQIPPVDQPAPIATSTSGTPTSTPTTPNPSPVTTTADVVRPRPQGALCDAQNFICVTTPVANTAVGNPITVSGTAIAFENTVELTVEDAQENVLASGFATAQAPDIGKPGSFTARAFLESVPRTATGFVVLFERSAKDGTPVHTVRVPVRFDQRATMQRSVYFVSEAAAQTSDCTQTQAVRVTLPASTSPIEATLRALLRTDSSDTPAGLVTMIPDRTRLVSLTLNNGVAKVVLDAGLERDGGGSCRVGAIRAQIEATLKQFPSVKTVEISVEGKTPEETLQP